MNRIFSETDSETQKIDSEIKHLIVTILPPPKKKKVAAKRIWGGHKDDTNFSLFTATSHAFQIWD